MNVRIAQQANSFDLTAFVMAYEGGELDDGQVSDAVETQ